MEQADKWDSPPFKDKLSPTSTGTTIAWIRGRRAYAMDTQSIPAKTDTRWATTSNGTLCDK